MFAPKSARADEVKQWLSSEGIPTNKMSVSANRQWVQFDASAQAAEWALRTEFYVYEHDETGVRNIACAGYHVPVDVQEHIDYVLPGIRLIADGFHRSNTRLSRRNAKAQSHQAPQSDIAYAQYEADDVVTGYEVAGNCDTEVTMDCIRTQYQIPNGTTETPGNELGVFESLGYHYMQDDLDSYFVNLAPWVPVGTAPILQSVDGGTGATTDSASSIIEANLDLQLAMPIVYPQKTKLFQVDDDYYEQDLASNGGTYRGLFNTFFDAIDGSYCTFSAYNMTGDCHTSDCLDPVYPDSHDPNGYQGPLMCGNYTPTNVISMSFSSVEHSLPVNYLKRQCAEVMKLALQGITRRVFWRSWRGRDF
jgi:tripeptidyl-peptidase-1